MTMICPVQGAEVPDDDESSLINQSEQKVFLILSVRRLRLARRTVTASVPLMRARSAGSMAATGSETLDGWLMPHLLTARTRKM